MTTENMEKESSFEKNFPEVIEAIRTQGNYVNPKYAHYVEAHEAQRQARYNGKGRR